MSARIVSHRALVLILMAGSFGAWGQAPLRKPDAPDPTTVQPKDAGAKRPAAAREQESRESVRGNARWAPAIANGSPLATSACTSAVSTSSVSTDPPLFPYTGGTAHLNVFAPSSCQWKVSGNVGWLTPGSGTSATVYSGQGTILFNVTANSGSFQTGQIIVSDAVNGNQLATHMVAQAAAPVAQPAGVNFNAATANFSYCTSPQAATSQQTIISIDGTPAIAQPVNAQAASGQNFPAAFSNAPSGKSCNWTVGAVSDNWLQGPALQSLVSTDATSGVAQVPFGVMANQSTAGAAPARQGSILLLPADLSGNTLTGLNVSASSAVVLQLNQQGGTVQCNYSLNPPSINVPPGGGPETISIGTGGPNSGCSWQLQTSNPDWILGLQGQNGTGDQPTFQFSVAQNSGTSPRSGYISILNQPQAGQITVTQTGVTCTPQVSSPGQSFGSGGGSSSFQVNLPASCQWTATSSNTSWLTIISGQGPGPGTVSFNASPNTSTSPQSATISIQGVAVFSVTESPATCSYSIPTPALTIGAAGGPGSFQVNTQPATGCSWTATPQENWITTTSSGTTSGTVNFNVGANSTTSSRPGSISVSNQSFNITQSGLTCSYSLSLTTISAVAAAATYPLQVSTSPGCQWTAQSSASWISLNPTSGTGPGSINVSVAVNNGSASQTGNVTIGPQGLVLTVTQAGAQNNTPPAATFSASPNPVPACGSQSTGTTTFTWNAPGTSGVLLYAGSASGTLLYSGPSSGSFTSSSVTNGEVVVLTDTSQHVLGQVTIYLNYACSATLTQAVMTAQTDFSNAICAVPNPQTTFTYQDSTSTLWFSMQNVPAGSTILAEFVDPYGNVDMTQTFNVNATSAQYCNAAVAGVFYDYPSGFVPATLPGGWTATLLLNGQVIGSFPYYISAPLTYNWTFTANASASNLSQPPYSAETKTFSTNDSGIYTYFSTVNSQTGDINHLYYWQWDPVNQVWNMIAETDYDPLSGGGVWYFSDELPIQGDAYIQQNPGYYGIVGSVTQGGTETPTFQEILSVTQPAQLQSSVSSLSFTYVVGGPAPAGQTVSVTSAPSGAAVSSTVTNGSPWLSAQLNSAVTPATLLVAVNPANLTTGVYTDSITLTTPGSSVTIPVTFNVTVIGPVLTSVSPTSAPALSGPVQLQANGQNFTSDAQVQWTGPGGTPVNLQTQFQSSVLLQATLPASYLTSPGTAQVAVGNSLGASNAIPFQVTVPTPTVSSVSPGAASVGSSQVNLAVNGSNFLNNAQVVWTAPGGSSTNLQTQYQNSTLLQATVPASYLSSPGTASVAVSNGGIYSNSVSFQITTASSPPQITSLSPNSVVTNVGGFSLLVMGSNFTASSSVFWNGTALPTSFISSTELSASVPPSDSYYTGSARITVGNAGLTSTTSSLAIVTPPTTFSNQMVTLSAPPSNGSCGSPTPGTSFLPSNGIIYLYFTGPVTTADNLYNDWVAPDGTVISGGNWSGANGNYCFTGASLTISSTPANRLGSWQVRLYDNGSLVFWLPFTIN